MLFIMSLVFLATWCADILGVQYHDIVHSIWFLA